MHLLIKMANLNFHGGIEFHLQKTPTSNELAGIRVVVTGCGYRERDCIFHDYFSDNPYSSTDDPLFLDDSSEVMKLNIGAASAGVLVRKGATVHMVSTSKEKLKNLADAFGPLSPNPNLSLEYSPVDLLDEGEVKRFVESLPRDKPLYWVQSVGLGAGSYQLPDDNPYLHLENIPLEFLEKEATTVLRATHLMMQKFLPIFKQQRQTRVAIISSMSAVRGYGLGGAHCAAKGALDRYANAAMLDLWRHNIFVTTIRPGAIDTGMYDGRVVRKAVCEISDQYDGRYREHFCLAPPSAVGQAVALAFTAPCHFPSINLVARGQFPNEGS